MFRGTFAIVDLRAIEQNVAAVRQRILPTTRLLVAVKANGYGHGAVQVAKAALAAGATDFGVATLEEALELRQSGIAAPILVLGAISPEAARMAAKWRVAVALTEDWSTQLLESTFDPPLEVHVKLDTGMSRLGFRNLDELLALARWLKTRKDIVWRGLFTHLACADAERLDRAEEQVQQFQKALEMLTKAGLRPEIAHAANSAAIFQNSAWQFDLVRLGISAYGYLPSPYVANAPKLEPALHLYSFITRVAALDAGEAVGYGATFIAERPTKVATVPIGYADGYPRILSNRASVIVAGKRAPVIGRVCMDQLMIDVTDIANVTVGDCVTLYGRQAVPEWHADRLFALGDEEQQRWLAAAFRRENHLTECLSLDELAELGHTISYEIMCALSQRVPRIYV